MTEHEAASADGSPADDEAGLVLRQLETGIALVVESLGESRVQAAFAAHCGSRRGHLDAQQFVAPGPEDGRIARTALRAALRLLAPAIGKETAAYLSGAVARLGDGSPLGARNPLTAGAAERVRHDPMHRAIAVMKTMIAGRVLFSRARVRDTDALACLVRLGMPGKPPRGYVAVEMALLQRAGLRGRSEKDWLRDKAKLTPHQRDLAEMAIRKLLGELSEADRARLQSEAGLAEALQGLAANSDPNNLDQLMAQMRHSWRQ